MKLTRLTPEQASHLPEIRDEWIAHGLNTEPADREAAEAGVRLAYRLAGLSDPRVFVWLDSPYGGAFAAAIMKSAQVGGQVRSQVRGQVRDQVRDQVWEQVRDQVWGQVWGQVWDQVWGQVRDQVRDQVRLSLCGQHDAGWLGWCDAWQRLGITAADKAAGLCEVAKAAGWWWAFEGAAVITERPTHLARDAGQRLHSTDGPAITYPGGWGFHAWHGVRVPQWVITNPTIESIGGEVNTEIRRCAIESFGWDRYLDALGVTPVATEPDPGNPGHLLALYDIPDDQQMYGERVRLVVMDNASRDRDGSRRRFAETVPGDIASPVAAQAWAFDVPESTYRAITRAT